MSGRDGLTRSYPFSHRFAASCGLAAAWLRFYGQVWPLMLACGLVNAHVTPCLRWTELAGL